MEKISRIVAIKRFFFADTDDPTEQSQARKEIMKLTKEDRAELGPLCAAALGCELEAEHSG